MTTIIQISDFHIKTCMGEPEHYSPFTKMVDKIKSLKKTDDDKLIIVFNGDVIDNTNIYEQIKAKPELTTSTEKAAFWEDKAKEEYALAVKYFNYMLTKAGISPQNLVLCCGNHDVNTWYDTKESTVDCPHGKEPIYSQKRFDLYEKFLKELRIDDTRKVQTYFVTINDINFLVANSNWLNKFECENKLCIDCKGINELIQSKRSALVKAFNKNKYKNVFVAHAPISDYCEEAKLGFEKNKYNPVIAKVDDLFGLQLFGDKHTGHAKGAEHIVGAPLDSERITCVAHQFTDDNKYVYRTITYKKDEDWEFTETEKYSKEILDVSERFIKDKAKEYLFDSTYVNTLDALKKFELIRASSKWRALNTLFKASSSVREPEPDKRGSGKPLPIGTDYINTITRLIAASESKINMMVRGGVRLGKSVCMSVLYLNMLYRFSCGSFDFIPVYINIENILQEIKTKDGNRDSKEYYDAVLSAVSDILEKGQKLCRTYEYDGCCIIDGLNKYCYYRNAKIDNGIMALLNQPENNCYKRRIYCVDTDNDTVQRELEYTDFHKNKEAQYLVYFNPVVTYKLHSDRYDSFIEAYCGLKGLSGDKVKETIDIIKENVSRMGILELDTNMMTYLWDQLCITDNRDRYFNLLEKFSKTKLSGITDDITKANFLISVEGRGYSDIIRICSINNETFDLLRTQPAIAQYLHACYYVETLCKYLNNHNPSQKEAARNERCLNQLFDHKACTLVREYIRETHQERNLLDFADLYYDSLRPAGQATLTYLVGRISSHRDEVNEQVNEQLNKQEKVLKEDILKAQGNPINNYLRIAERSIILSRMFSTDSNHEQQKAVLDYVRKLISNENDRKINRRFHLQFYSDRGNYETSLNSDKINDGFDIYCTYHILCQRIQKQMDHPGEQRLLALEIFTLCDLIQLRIDNPIAYYKDQDEEKETDSFFYKEKYNNPKDTMAISIITNMKNIVSSYIDLYKNNADDLFNEYLKHQLDTYDKILPILEKGPLLAETNRYKPEACLQTLVKFEETKRMGWLFHDLYKTISEPHFLNKRKSDECYETTLQHVFEMYLIGMLYLPKESDHADYDKKTILDLVMIHDLGESHTGDSIKAYVNHEDDKKEEKEWCRNLYLQGVHEGVADLTDYGKLWDQWNDSSNPTYNVKVAQDLDKLQLLYKLSILVTQEDPVHFSKNRFMDFWDLRLDIKTNEVIRIFNILVAGNKDFAEVAKAKYETQVNVLHER